MSLLLIALSSTDSMSFAGSLLGPALYDRSFPHSAHIAELRANACLFSEAFGYCQLQSTGRDEVLDIVSKAPTYSIHFNFVH